MSVVRVEGGRECVCGKREWRGEAASVCGDANEKNRALEQMMVVCVCVCFTRAARGCGREANRECGRGKTIKAEKSE